MRFVWPFMLFLLSLPACSELQPDRSSGYAPVVSLGNGIDDWLEELHNTREMTPDEIRQTVQAWEQALRDDPSADNHIKLALLLTTGDTSVRDPERARELLIDLDLAPCSTVDRELVTILWQILDEQELANMTTSKLRRQVRQQSERIKELEEQQRALTDIEQNIQERDIQPDLDYDTQ